MGNYIMHRKLVISFFKLSLKFICHYIPEETGTVDFASKLDALYFFQLCNMEMSTHLCDLDNYKYPVQLFG